MPKRRGRSPRGNSESPDFNHDAKTRVDRIGTSFPIENIPRSITEKEKREFYWNRIFLQCQSAPTEARRYHLKIQPTSREKGSEELHSVDLSKWVLMEGFDHPLEETKTMMIREIQTRNDLKLLISEEGTIQIRKTKSGQVFAKLDTREESGVELTCQPTVVVCRSSTPEILPYLKNLPYFFLILSRQERDSWILDLSFDHLLAGFSSPLTGTTGSRVKGKMTPPHLKLKFQDLKGSLTTQPDETGRIRGNLSVQNPSLELDSKNAPLDCKMGI